LSGKRGRPRSSIDGADAAVERIKALQESLGLTERALADRVGINQSSVSRALRRVPPAWSPSLKKIWEYAENIESVDGSGSDYVVARETLTTAALDAWDGTASGLDRLVQLLVALGRYKKTA
jgi:transcriptional regulator with XRE-family HTH domain